MEELLAWARDQLVARAQLVDEARLVVLRELEMNAKAEAMVNLSPSAMLHLVGEWMPLGRPMQLEPADVMPDRLSQRIADAFGEEAIGSEVVGSISFGEVQRQHDRGALAKSKEPSAAKGMTKPLQATFLGFGGAPSAWPGQPHPALTAA